MEAVSTYVEPTTFETVLASLKEVAAMQKENAEQFKQAKKESDEQFKQAKKERDEEFR
jgi:hypothetical protein